MVDVNIEFADLQLLEVGEVEDDKVLWNDAEDLSIPVEVKGGSIASRGDCCLHHSWGNIKSVFSRIANQAGCRYAVAFLTGLQIPHSVIRIGWVPSKNQ